jgi:hypothetical protein
MNSKIGFEAILVKPVNLVMLPQMDADGRGFLHSTLNSLPRRSERRRVNIQLSTILWANLAKLLHKQDFRDGL